MMIAQDMLELSEKYKKDVNDMHQLFYEVSCDREELIRLLEGQSVTQWTVLEDLALKGDTGSEAYKHVRSVKNEEAI